MTAARMVLEIVAYLVGGLLLLVGAVAYRRAEDRGTAWALRTWWDDPSMRFTCRVHFIVMPLAIAFFGVVAIVRAAVLIMTWMSNGI